MPLNFSGQQWESVGYRWWSVFYWKSPNDLGVKLGPVSLMRYQWDGWQYACCVLNRWSVFDTGLRRFTRP